MLMLSRAYNLMVGECGWVGRSVGEVVTLVVAAGSVVCTNL